MELSKLEKEAYEVVNRINDEQFAQYEKDDRIGFTPSLSVMFTGYTTLIQLHPVSSHDLQLPEIHLWDSENDGRIYYEATDSYESLYKCVKRRFKEIKTKLNAIKL